MILRGRIVFSSGLEDIFLGWCRYVLEYLLVVHVPTSDVEGRRRTFETQNLITPDSDASVKRVGL